MLSGMLSERQVAILELAQPLLHPNLHLFEGVPDAVKVWDPAVTVQLHDAMVTPGVEAL